MVTAFCRAKDPKTCKYHGTQMLMLQAQSDGKFDDYLKYRNQLEDLEKLGDLEATNWQVAEKQELFADTQHAPTRQQQPAPTAPTARVIRTEPKSTVEAGRIPLTSEEYMQTNNKVFDVVEAPIKLVNAQGKPTGKTENVKFYLHKDGVTPAQPAYIRIQTNHRLSTEDTRALSGLLGYAYRVNVGGARLGAPQRDTPFSFIVQADTSLANPRSGGDNLASSLGELEETFATYIEDGGSPKRVRQNNTRAIEVPADKSDIQFKVFYDSVIIDVPAETEAAATPAAPAKGGTSKNFTSGQLKAGLRPGGKLRTQYQTSN